MYKRFIKVRLNHLAQTWCFILDLLKPNTRFYTRLISNQLKNFILRSTHDQNEDFEGQSHKPNESEKEYSKYVF